MGRFVLLACLAMAAGCDRGAGDRDADTDAGADGAPDGDASEADLDAAADPADRDADAAESCLDLVRPDETFILAPDLPETQIHPVAAFDGEAVWVVFNVPEEAGSGFDVWALRLACDRSFATEPFRVNTTVEPNDVDPALALSADRVVVAWQSDTGVVPVNMHTYYRLFAVDGTPLIAEDRPVQTTRGGLPLEANAWMPSVAILPDGFALAGSRAIDELGSFQVYVQRFDAEGVPAGNTVEPFLDAEVSESYPSLAAISASDLVVAWAREPAEADGEVVWKRLDDGSAPPEPVAPGEGLSGAPSLAVDREDPSHLMLAFHVARGEGAAVRLVDLGAALPDRPTLVLGQASTGIDQVPTVALEPGGGAVGWFRNVSGLQNDVIVEGFRREGAALVGDGEILLRTEGAAPAIYGIGLTYVGGDVYFVTWAEGDNPAFMLFGRFVTVR
jgi:hypothetical protein